MSNKDIPAYIKKIKGSLQKLIENGHLEEAELLLNQLYNYMPADPDVCSMRSITALLKGDSYKAEKILKVGLYQTGENFDLLYNMGYIKENQGNYADAASFYFRAKGVASGAQAEIVEDAIRNLSGIDSRIGSNNHQLRVLHGTMEIANQMCLLTRGLKKIGLKADSCNYYPNYLSYKSDYTYDILRMQESEDMLDFYSDITQRYINNYDIFHFHFSTSLSPDNTDLPLLLGAGKKVFMHHWGSDVRLYSKAVRLSKYVKVKYKDEDAIKLKLENLSKYIDTCIVGDYELYEYVKDYYNKIYVVPVAMDLDELKPAEEISNTRPLVVHAPTSKFIKGTEYIVKAVDELKLKYDFDFKLVANMTNECAKDIYRQADIIIDQLLVGCYGVFAIESMALGKPVITYISEFMQDKYPKDLPIFSANPDNIREQLEILLKDKSLRKELGLKGRIYAEKYHDVNKVCQRLMDIYKA